MLVMDALLTLPLRGERRMRPKPGVKVLPALLPSPQPITPLWARARQEPQLARITSVAGFPGEGKTRATARAGQDAAGKMDGSAQSAACARDLSTCALRVPRSTPYPACGLHRP